ncbi:recombination-associated protein RdgC [Pokkaliibacter sp. CJK22405]|uniref:recombination-associated protein RdgC n=1 Tax=Pokkaliibacter sp. CJK22405 TaxID=3384615 RepID=UPI0039854D5A
MLFKNLVIYTFSQPFSLDEEKLQAALESHRFQPCSSQEKERLGWVSPLTQNQEQLFLNSQGYFLLKSKRQEKLLPSQVVNELVQERLEKLEEEQSRRPTKKERQDVKDQVTLELLPRAFSRHQFSFLCIAPEQGWIAVDTSSYNKAEPLLNLLREGLGSFPVIPPRVKQSPAVVMTSWLNDATSVPEEVVIADECELRDPADDGGIIKIRRQALDSDEIQTHLEAGKQATKLRMSWQDSLEFMLCDDLTFKRVQASERLQDELEHTETDNRDQELDALFTMSALELNRLLPQWLEWFGGKE